MDSLKRPMPPKTLSTDVGGYPLLFTPAKEVLEWARNMFMNERSKLYNEDHNHLIDANINFLWAAGGFTKQGNTVIGQAEQVTFRCGPWQKARQEQQMMEWFGFHFPEYLITLDASYCNQCTDAEFCALVEHELLHIGHKLNEFGEPMYSRDTGLPILAMKSHDVEEFVSVVKRYGVAKGSKIDEMVRAANSKPLISQIDIASACGTCIRKAA